MRAAAEFHHRRLQLQGGVTALEPERMRAITVLRERLERRRQQGLPVPTELKRQQAVRRIQARVRGYLARLWTWKVRGSSLGERGSRSWPWRCGAGVLWKWARRGPERMMGSVSEASLSRPERMRAIGVVRDRRAFVTQQGFSRFSEV